MYLRRRRCGRRYRCVCGRRRGGWCVFYRWYERGRGGLCGCGFSFAGSTFSAGTTKTVLDFWDEKSHQNRQDGVLFVAGDGDGSAADLVVVQLPVQGVKFLGRQGTEGDLPIGGDGKFLVDGFTHRRIAPLVGD